MNSRWKVKISIKKAIDAHSWKSRGEGALFFDKIPGAKCALYKNTTESTIFGFIAFLLPRFLKICLGVLRHVFGYIYEVTPDQLNPEDYLSLYCRWIVKQDESSLEKENPFLARVPVKCYYVSAAKSLRSQPHRYKGIISWQF